MYNVDGIPEHFKTSQGSGTNPDERTNPHHLLKVLVLEMAKLDSKAGAQLFPHGLKRGKVHCALPTISLTASALSSGAIIPDHGVRVVQCSFFF